jgi:hypothetical protein
MCEDLEFVGFAHVRHSHTNFVLMCGSCESLRLWGRCPTSPSVAASKYAANNIVCTSCWAQLLPAGLYSLLSG